VRDHEESIRERSQEAFMLQKQLSDLHSEMLRLKTTNASSGPSMGHRNEQREHDLLMQMDDLENSYQRRLAELAANLDAVKTENLTMCLEVQDVGELAQRLSQEVRAADLQVYCICQ
jgi:hypothetical protein